MQRPTVKRPKRLERRRRRRRELRGGQPVMRVVPVKSVEPQSERFLHRARQGDAEQRTALVKRVRGLLSGLGIVLPQKAGTIRRERVHLLEDLPGQCNTELYRYSR